MKSISLPSDSGPVMARTSLSIGDRVVTPTGSQGVIIPPNHEMPLHHLIQFESGAVLWMLKEILQPAPDMATKKRRAIA